MFLLPVLNKAKATADLALLPSRAAPASVVAATCMLRGDRPTVFPPSALLGTFLSTGELSEIVWVASTLSNCRGMFARSL